MGVGQVVKRLRSRRGLSQEDLAEKAGVSAGNVSDIETKDRTPRLDTLDKIAAILETTSEAILKEAGVLAPSKDKPENETLVRMVDVAKGLSEPRKKAALRILEALFDEQVEEQS